MPEKGKTNNPNGRPKGAKNKNTLDIKAIIDKHVDWAARVQNLVKMADAGNVQAEKMLWEYRIGKPVQPLETPENQPLQHNHTITPSDKLITLANKLAGRN
jgi:hypothetical protein